MRGFYILLAAVGIGGAAWLVYAARQKPAERPAPTTPVPAAPASGFTGYTLGSDSAPVHITVYSDFQCPYCASFVTVQMPEVRAQLINTGKVQFRFRPFPLPSHQHSQIAALAAECAGEQGKFWEMHDQLFYNQNQWAQTRNPSGKFRDFARTIGLDSERYDACIDSKRYAGRVEESRQEGIAAGVDATPKFYFDGGRFNGFPTSDLFKTVVDSMIMVKVRKR
jgi:protein-disulfide isomerase